MRQTLATAPTHLPSSMAREVIEIDLGDRWSRDCVLDQAGTVVEEDRVRPTPEALKGNMLSHSTWEVATRGLGKMRERTAVRSGPNTHASFAAIAVAASPTHRTARCVGLRTD